MAKKVKGNSRESDVTKAKGGWLERGKQQEKRGSTERANTIKV